VKIYSDIFRGDIDSRVLAKFRENRHWEVDENHIVLLTKITAAWFTSQPLFRPTTEAAAKVLMVLAGRC